jgi:hypothetical protein
VSSRFLTGLGVLLSGVLVVVFALQSVAVGWITLGCACTALILALFDFAGRGRSPAARRVDVTVAVLAAWTIVAARAFSPPAVRWIAFGDGTGLASLGLLALLVRERELARQLAVGRAWLRTGAPLSRIDPREKPSARSGVA